MSNAHRRDSRELRASLELELSPNNKSRLDAAPGREDADGSDRHTPKLPEKPGLPKTPGTARVNSARLRAVSPEEVEAARIAGARFPGGYPGAGGSAAGRKKAAGAVDKRSGR